MIKSREYSTSFSPYAFSKPLRDKRTHASCSWSIASGCISHLSEDHRVCQRDGGRVGSICLLDAVIDEHPISNFGFSAESRRCDELFDQDAPVGRDDPP